MGRRSTNPGAFLPDILPQDGGPGATNFVILQRWRHVETAPRTERQGCCGSDGTSTFLFAKACCEDRKAVNTRTHTVRKTGVTNRHYGQVLGFWCSSLAASSAFRMVSSSRDIAIRDGRSRGGIPRMRCSSWMFSAFASALPSAFPSAIPSAIPSAARA